MAPGAKKKLYKVDPARMSFGVQKGSHVAHMFDEFPSKLKGFSPISAAGQNRKNGYADVSKEEVYSNIGEIKSAETFRQLAEMSNDLFEKYQDDKDIAAFCYSVKDYITADGRAPQQKALTNMKLRFNNTRAKLMNRINEIAMLSEQTEKTQAAKASLEEMYNGMNAYQELVINNLNGNLTIDRNNKNAHYVKDDIEPKDAFTGKVGSWKKSSDSLFPHEPTPNDVKQGIGVQDCYCLSVLTQVAATDPGYIKDMLKDNDDGTVTVRFFTRNAKKEPEPVYVTVNKTVNKSAFGQDLYANSSLWVQMIEKAYAKFNAAYGVLDPMEPDLEKNQKGMNSMWRGNSCFFMNAIFDKDYSYVQLPLSHSSRVYEKDKDGNFINHPDYYLPEEEKVFDILYQTINVDKGIATTMPEKETLNLQKSPHDVGLRNGHIYTIRGVFEQDGKKFVQLRDPYGTVAAGYDKNGKLVNKADAIDILKNTIKSGGETMGTFNMELKDYMKYFNIIQGIPQARAAELEHVAGAERDYDADPLTPDEMVSKENYDADTFKKRSIIRRNTNNLSPAEKEAMVESEKSIIEANKILAKAYEESFAARDLQEATDLMNNPEKLAEFAKQINDAYQDIKATDELFVMTNTKEFKEMRDSLKDLNKDLANLQKGKPGKLTPEKLAERIKTTRQTSANYTEKKAESIGKKIGIYDRTLSTAYFLKHGRYPKVKTLSDRTFHRFTSSVSINNICSYQKPLGNWPGKTQEALSIYRSDLEKRLEMAKKGETVKGNDIPEWKLKDIHKNIVRMQEKDFGHLTELPKEKEAAQEKKSEAPSVPQ